MADTSTAVGHNIRISPQHLMSRIGNSPLLKVATKGQWKNIAMISGGLALTVIAAVGLFHGVSLFGISAQSAATLGAGGLLTFGCINYLGRSLRNSEEIRQEEEQEQLSRLSHANDEYLLGLTKEND